MKTTHVTTHKDKITFADSFRMFPDDDTARDQFEQWRWGDTKHCPHCDSVRISQPANQPMRYRCKDCRKRFSVRTNTIMAHSNLSFQNWMLALYIATTGIKETASTKIASDIGSTQKTAWFLGHRIRKAWESEGALMQGVIEVDETHNSGKEKNKHASKKLNVGRGTVGKAAVVGIKSRDCGRVKAFPIETNDRQTPHSDITHNVSAGSDVYTDDWPAYRQLTGYNNAVVQHSIGEFVKGQAHTNGIESFWALLKRGYHGTHRWMSAKHLHRYVNEFSHRHSVRKIDTIHAMQIIAIGMISKGFKYKDLIK